MSNYTNWVGTLATLKDQWNSFSNINEDLTPLGKPTIKKSDIAQVFATLAEELNELSEQSVELDPFELDEISLSISTLANLIANIPGNPQGHLIPLIQNLEGLRFKIDVFTIRHEDEISDRSFLGLKKKMSKALASAKEGEALLIKTRNEIDSLKSRAGEVNSAAQETTQALATTKANETAVTATAGKISDLEKKLEGTLASAETIVRQTAEQNALIVKQQEELAALKSSGEAALRQAEELLADANRNTLAGAFKTRRDALKWPLLIWGGVFGFSILVLAIFAYVELVPNKSEVFDWHSLIMRLPASAPLIWLGWFSAKQYGYSARLKEDYAFKVAAAMSFEGYKREISNDPELMKKLQESAIGCFAENPLRIYESSTNHASPLHELFSQLSEDEKTSAVLGALKG